MFCIRHRYCWFGALPVAQVPEVSLSGLQGLGIYVPLTKVGALNKVRSQYECRGKANPGNHSAC